MARTIAKIVAAALGLVLSGCLILWVGGRDLPSPLDEDMKLRRTDVRAEDNAFVPLQEAAEKLDWTDEHDALLRPVLDGKDGDRPRIEELLTRNRHALETLDQALQRGRLQVPEERPVDKTPYSLTAWRRLGHLLALRAHSRGNDGNVRAALEDALELLRFGHLVQGGQGNLITYLVGSSMKSVALSQVRSLIAGPLDPGLLEALPARLESFRPDGAALRETLQFEYTYWSALIDDPGQVHENGPRHSLEESATLKRFGNDSLLSRYVFQKNATKKLYADRYREMSNAADESCSRAASADPDPAADKKEIVKTFWKPNVVGRTFFRIAMPSMRGLLVAKCRLRTELSATRLLVALKAYREKRGELPASLEPLVPDYLPALPVDDFGGQPLRYSPQAGIVYSVGEDLLDDRGDQGKDRVLTITSCCFRER